MEKINKDYELDKRKPWHGSLTKVDNTRYLVVQ